MTIRLNIHLQDNTLIFSTISSTSKLVSLKNFSFPTFHNTNIVACQINHRTFLTFLFLSPPRSNIQSEQKGLEELEKHGLATTSILTKPN